MICIFLFIIIVSNLLLFTTKIGSYIRSIIIWLSTLQNYLSKIRNIEFKSIILTIHKVINFTLFLLLIKIIDYYEIFFFKGWKCLFNRIISKLNITNPCIQFIMILLIFIYTLESTKNNIIIEIAILSLLHSIYFFINHKNKIILDKNFEGYIIFKKYVLIIIIILSISFMILYILSDILAQFHNNEFNTNYFLIFLILGLWSYYISYISLKSLISVKSKFISLLLFSIHSFIYFSLFLFTVGAYSLLITPVDVIDLYVNNLYSINPLNLNLSPFNNLQENDISRYSANVNIEKNDQFAFILSLIYTGLSFIKNSVHVEFNNSFKIELINIKHLYLHMISVIIFTVYLSLIINYISNIIFSKENT